MKSFVNSVLPILLIGFALIIVQQMIKENESDLTLIILGNAQDAGYPQANCVKDCCIDTWQDKSKRRMVTSIAIAEKESKKWWLFDATPDVKDQMFLLQNALYSDYTLNPAGIFLTHAHIGHYTGLVQFGKEAIASSKLPVYAMPKMKKFIKKNAPFSQLVKLKNIALKNLENEVPVKISKNYKVTPILVPHRDEFSETVGFKIKGKNKSALFIPDIDSWKKWKKEIKREIKKVDYAFLDGSFFDASEMPNTDMKDIPHPTIEQSFAYFKSLDSKEKAKIYFIHFNHTNPVLRQTEQRKMVKSKGFNVAEQGAFFAM